MKTGSLEPPPPITLTYILGAFRLCRATSSFPFAPRAHSSPPSLFFPFFDLFWCLAEKPGRAEPCFQPCLLVRPWYLCHISSRERGVGVEMERMGRAYLVHPFLSASASLLFNILHALCLPVSLCLFPFLKQTILIETWHCIKSSRSKNQSPCVDLAGPCCTTVWSPRGTRACREMLFLAMGSSLCLSTRKKSMCFGFIPLNIQCIS